MAKIFNNFIKEINANGIPIFMLPPFSGKVGDKFLHKPHWALAKQRYTIVALYEHHFLAVTQYGVRECFQRFDVQSGQIQLRRTWNE